MSELAKENLDYIRDVYSSHPMVLQVVSEVERLRKGEAKLAARDSLIERLVEAGEHPISVARSWEWLTGAVDKWDVAVAEWQAMKGGEG